VDYFTLYVFFFPLSPLFCTCIMQAIGKYTNDVVKAQPGRRKDGTAYWPSYQYKGHGDEDRKFMARFSWNYCMSTYWCVYIVPTTFMARFLGTIVCQLIGVLIHCSHE
jgi:hypothetical protein